MADVIKKATRESYGEALAELSSVYPDLSFSMPTLLRLQRQAFSRKPAPKDFSTAVLPRLT